ncbi:zinc-ribbon domain-containing protein [Aromatoleum toluolicum]|uniref:Zinc-ribbon domain-containing protein n=1 Tax=Aromatoleum toluolicum TaxID=90060 RepID=A0ABX1NGJ3_9RHOO|nr:zinc ribbon domain-containing protein [Aromatoleum toluolicum]NMF98417.1 zinc-ribbon domain-containing protein [Aromatoleum toluolicum]
MAIIACPECRKDVSDKAKLCPSCGYRIRKSKFLKVLATSIIGGVAILVVSGIAVGRMSSISAKNAVLNRIGNNHGSSVTITKYSDNNRTGEHYVCGVAGRWDASTGKLDAPQLFFVVQKGWLSTTEKAYIQSDQNFWDIYSKIARCS